MSDLIYLAITVGFFAAAVGLLRACERIIGPDTPTSTPADHRRGLGGSPGGGPMSADNLVGLVLAVATIGYLIVALVFPEKF